jgi:hypothetical protein
MTGDVGRGMGDEDFGAIGDVAIDILPEFDAHPGDAVFIWINATVGVGIRPDGAANADAAPDTEVDGEVGVRVSVTVIGGFESWGEGDDGTEQGSARTARLAAVVVIVHRVIDG